MSEDESDISDDEYESLESKILLGDSSDSDKVILDQGSPNFFL